MKNNPADIAVGYFGKGYNCAESVLMGLAESGAVEESDLMPRIATGFGGGVGRCGEICGALSGGIMALSLRFGRTNPDDKEARARTYPKVAGLVEAFEQEFGNVRCLDLTGCDMQAEEGRAEFEKRGLHAGLCAKLVKFATEETSRLLSNE